MRVRSLAHLVVVVALAGGTLAPPAGAGVHARLETPSVVVAANAEFDVEFRIFHADEPFNAFDASFRFDSLRVSYVPSTNLQGSLMTAACFNRFHVFGAASDSLKATIVLLCAGTTVTGPGQLYKVRFKAGTTPGTTYIRLGPHTQFYNGGPTVAPLEAEHLQICITTCTTDVGPGAAPAFAMLAPSPNPWSGAGPASFAFDLPRGGPVRLTLHDVSGRLIASRDGGWFEAGRHAITLARPDVHAGIYFARLHSPLGTASRAVVLER